MPFEKKISVQICSYNRKTLLKEAVSCLFDQTLPKDQYEVIVVDDGSTDGTADMIAALKSPINLVFIRQEKEGLAAGRNKGIRKAQGEIILFIDDDVLADRRLLEEHVYSHERYPNSVIKGWVNHVDFLARPQTPKWTLRDYSRAFFWTSNVSVAKHDLVNAGLFDESFTEYGWEDLELGLRLKAGGLQSRTNRKAIGYHYKKSMQISDIPAMLSQAEAKGRTAVVFVRRNQGWRARFSTGIYPVRLFLDYVFSSRPLVRLYESGLQRKKGAMSFWTKLCARGLEQAYYFRAIRKALE